MSPVSFLFHFRNQFSGIFRHRTVLGTYIGTHLHGDAVCFLDRLAVQDGGTETSCEGVACTYGILNPTQMHLLKLFSFNKSEDFAKEIQQVLTRYFQEKLDAETDRLWDEGILNQERLDEIRREDLHAK